MNAKNTKKVRAAKLSKTEAEDLRPEYHFDYRQARPNRFAGKGTADRLVVVLDPDIAAVFTTPEAVNTILRALITTMPPIIRQKQAA
jgi:hypothetical protein